MPRKRTYESIRDFINGDQGNGCTLITKKEDYIDTQHYIEIKCKCTIPFQTTFGDFLTWNKRQCDNCGKIIRINKRKLPFEKVKHFIEVESNSGCKLKSKYINCKLPIDIECKCGRLFITTYDGFKHKNIRSCHECCRKDIRLDYNDIQDYFNKNITDYTLLDMKIRYNKSNRRMIYIKVKCSNSKHDSYWVSYNDFKYQTKRCSKCFYESRTDLPLIWTNEKIICLLNDFNLKLIDNSIKISARRKIPCINKDGYKVNVTINTLSRKKSQPHPFIDKQFALENFKILCLKYGFRLLENQIWKGLRHRYDALTEEGYLVQILAQTFIRGRRPRIFSDINKFTFENINLYCKLKRPDYILIYLSKSKRKKKSVFKYIGNKINMSDSERYFKITVDRFLYNHEGHPKLSYSLGENIIETWLINNKIKYKCQFKFDNCIHKKKLRFDFAILTNKMISFMIEFQGKQHYEPVELFGGDEYFIINQIRDNIKKQYCENNNISLLRIPYWQINNINKILNDIFYNHENINDIQKRIDIKL
jgi:hypothetical protein